MPGQCDRTLTLTEFQLYVQEMERQRGFAGQSLMQQCLLFGEEVGELFRGVRHLEGLGVDVNSTHDSNLAGELADLLIYIASIANRLDINLTGAFYEKEAVNASRQWIAS